MKMHRHKFGPWYQVNRPDIYETETAKIETIQLWNYRDCQDETCRFVEARKADNR